MDHKELVALEPRPRGERDWQGQREEGRLGGSWEAQAVLVVPGSNFSVLKTGRAPAPSSDPGRRGQGLEAGFPDCWFICIYQWLCLELEGESRAQRLVTLTPWAC